MGSSEKWQRRITWVLAGGFGICFIIMFCDGVRSTGLGPKGAWAVSLLAMLAVLITWYIGSALHNRELKRHVLDVTAHPGGLESMNQDLVKMGNFITEHREMLAQLPDLRSRLEQLESWEADVVKGVQAHVEWEKITKVVSELSIATTSRCEGLGVSMRELHKKVVELESARQRLAELEKLSGEVVATKEAVGGLAALPAQLSKLEAAVAQSASLAQDVAALKEEMEPLSALPEDLRKSAERFAERFSSLAAELAAVSQEFGGLKKIVSAFSPLSADVAALKEAVGGFDARLEQAAKAASPEQPAAPSQEVAAVKEGLASLAGLPEDLRKMSEQSAQRSAALAEDLARVKKQLDQQKKLGEDLEKVQAELTDLSALPAEIGKLQQQCERLAEAAAKRPRAEGAAPSAAGANVAGLDAIAAEVAEMKKVVSHLQAEQPNLDVNIKEAKLVSQQDRTVIVCTLTVRNLSNKPNEITAVRAELDSGRNRMAPTAVRHWLPDGKQTNEERLILLPQKVLESSTTAPITLTAIGWPLEKTQEAYAFRITLRDKNGNEYVKNHQLTPEPAAK